MIRLPLLSLTRALHWLLLLFLAGMSVVLHSACSEKKAGEIATQVAARVDKAEITVHQINQVLLEQPNLRPEQADSVSRQILERLIDQEVAAQRAEEFKLDRDPRVVQMFLAAKRQMLARAYAEKIGEAAVKPTPGEVKKYYDDNPALFRERRIYNLDELAIEAKPDQMLMLRERLGAAKSITELVEYLKANDYRFVANQVVRPAEQLPPGALHMVSRMKDGQVSMLDGSAGIQVVALVGSRSQPVSEEQAKQAIEQFLLNDRKRKLVEHDLKALRAAARIAYHGKFAEGPRPAAVASAPSALPVHSAASGAGLSPTDISKAIGLK